jgi:hypothetical protein
VKLGGALTTHEPTIQRYAAIYFCNDPDYAALSLDALL